MQRNSPARSFLSPEESALVQAACVTLTEANKPSKFAFWGKINGVQNDYYIVQSFVFVPQEFPATFYSRDGMTWSKLAPAPDALINSGAYLNGPFTGEPTAPYTYSVSEPLNLNATEQKPPVENTIREEERLAYVVQCVDAEGIMIPKYSYDNDMVGPVVPAPSYRGMSFDDCSNLENYLTFNPTNKAQWRAAAAAGDRPRQMLQPLLHSCPENMTDHPRWRLSDKTYENFVVFHNIHWPGLIFYHDIDGTSFGRFHCGRGLREISVPFLYGAPGDTLLSVDISIVPDYDMNVSFEERERIKKEKFDAEEKAAQEADFDERYDAGGSVYSSEGEQIENAELLETGEVQPIDYSAPPSEDEQGEEDTEASENETTENTSAYTTGGGDTTELETSDTESTR